MRQLAIGLTMALLSSVAFAQGSAPQVGEKGSAGSVSATGEARNGASRAGAAEHSDRGSAARSQTNIRVGVEARGRDRDEVVRTRGVVHERAGVEVRHRRSVTAVSTKEPESRIIVRHGHAKKKVVFRKKRHGVHYVVRGHRRVVEEPTVSVRHRSVHRIETSEPGVSIRSRTSVRRSHEEGVRGGATLERRETGARSSTQTGVSATNRETRGAEGRQSSSSASSTKTTVNGGGVSPTTQR